MSGFYYAATACTPEIKLDPAAAFFSMEGESYPGDAQEFYTPIIEGLKQLPEAQNLRAQFRMYYLDSTTAHFIAVILDLLDERFQNGAEISVIWYYRNDDDDLLECGEDYAEELELPFELEGWEP